VQVSGQVFYRIQLIDHEYHNYSRVVLLSSNEIPLGISGLVNPFQHIISFNLTVPQDNVIQLSLYDSYGRKLAGTHQTVYKGINRVEFREPAKLAPGLYILQILYKGEMISRQMIRD